MYRQLAEAYGWTPQQVSQMTLAQIATYLSPDKSSPAERSDDWSQFGLRRKGNMLHGPMRSLLAYRDYRKEQEA